MKSIKLKTKTSESELSNLLFEFANENHYDEILNDDCDCFDSQGKPVLFLRKNYIDKDVLYNAYKNLEKAAKPTSNRGVSSGGDRKHTITKDGKKTKTLQVYDKKTGEEKPLHFKNDMDRIYEEQKQETKILHQKHSGKKHTPKKKKKRKKK